MATTTADSQPPALTEQQHDAVRFLMRLGHALHRYSYSTQIMEEKMQRVAEELGMSGQFFFSPTMILAVFGRGREQRPYMIRTTPGGVDLGKLVEVDQVADRVVHGETAPLAGVEQLDKIVARPDLYSAWVRVFAFGLSSAAFARFLDGGLHEIGTSFFVGCLIGLCDYLAPKFGVLSRNFELFASFFAAALAFALGSKFGGSSIFIATLAGSVALLPGLAVTVSMSELSSGHLLSGTVRLSGAMVVLVSLIFGNALGGAVAQMILRGGGTSEPRSLPDWTIWLAMIAAGSAFVVIFRAHPRDYAPIVVVSLLTSGVNLWLQERLNPALSAFVAAAVATLASLVYALLLKRPSMVTLVPAILVVVPGSIGYRGLMALMERNFESGLEGAFNMVLVAVAIAGGMIVAFELWPGRRR